MLTSYRGRKRRYPKSPKVHSIPKKDVPSETFESVMKSVFPPSRSIDASISPPQIILLQTMFGWRSDVLYSQNCRSKKNLWSATWGSQLSSQKRRQMDLAEIPFVGRSPISPHVPRICWWGVSGIYQLKTNSWEMAIILGFKYLTFIANRSLFDQAKRTESGNSQLSPNSK